MMQDYEPWFAAKYPALYGKPTGDPEAEAIYHAAEMSWEAASMRMLARCIEIVAGLKSDRRLGGREGMEKEVGQTVNEAVISSLNQVIITLSEEYP